MSALDYMALLKAARFRQLKNDADAVRALDALYAKTIRELREKILKMPRGTGSERYQQALLESFEDTLNAHRDEYKTILDDRMLAAAVIVEERERFAYRIALALRNETPQLALFAAEAFETSVTSHLAEKSFGEGVGIMFGEVPRRVVETLYARTYPDGIKLSDRLYRLDSDLRGRIKDTVVQGVASGTSARKLGKSLEALLGTPEQQRRDDLLKAARAEKVKKYAEIGKRAPADDNLRYRARRIARTEINNAFREGHIASVTDAQGNPLPHVSAIGWRLSPAHPRPDICDWFASADGEDLGPGNYSPGNTPVSHPNCLCYTVTILVALPKEQFVSKAAQPDLVTEAQKKYYGVTI
jgi:hypothetical protein